MWRRVASQSPDAKGVGGEMPYKMAYAAISDLLFGGHSLSGQERNSLFLNVGNRQDGGPGKFANASFLTGFGVDDDTRGVAMVDWDGDGDLDVWLTNRTAPRLRLLRNNLDVEENGWAAFRLEGTTCNRDAIGARLVLTLPSGRKLYRSRRCGEGFLTQNSAWVHFGLGTETAGPLELRVHWPDGKSETFTDLVANKRWHLRQGESMAEEVPAPPASERLVAGEVDVAEWETQSRTVLVGRLPLPEISGHPVQKDPVPSSGNRGLLYLFAASWCQPCASELAQLSRAAATLEKQGIGVRILAVPGEGVSLEEEAAAMKKLLEKLEVPFPAKVIDPELAGALDVFHRSFLSLRRPLPLPSSFLADSQNRLAVIYRGPVTPEQILSDIPTLTKPAERIREEDLPFPGQWVAKTPQPDIVSALVAWKREGYLEHGRRYLEKHLDHQASLPANRRAPLSHLTLLCEHLVDFTRLQHDDAGVEAAYKRALTFAPNYVSAVSALGNHYGRLGRLDEAIPYLEKSLHLAPEDSQARFSLGVARVKKNQLPEARDLFLQAVRLDPSSIPARINLLKMRIALKEWPAARIELLQIWRALPGNREVADFIPHIMANLSPEEQVRWKQELEAAAGQRR